MQPGGFNPKGEDWIGREFAELKREIRELKAANVFGLTGIKPKDGGTDLDGFVNINGPLEVNGEMEVNGAMKVTGTLELPAGIIGNDALENPITGDVQHRSTSEFGLSTTNNGAARMITLTVLVPPGFTRALVMASADMTATNTTPDDDYAFLDVQVAGEGPAYVSGTDTRPGRFSFIGANYARNLADVETSFEVTVDAGTDRAPWPAAEENVVNLNVVVTFLR